ncbi:MAG: hypothetical protein JNJ92_00030 [Altererythrobacter sp.]|nr:hypothetical protein [Altererythrobacter sp.]
MTVSRFTALGICLVGALSAALNWPSAWAGPVLTISITLMIVGAIDLSQPRHSIRRN